MTSVNPTTNPATNPDCIFCRIVAGQIPSTKVYEDDHLLAFRDIQPAAPIHVLFIPKQHIANLNGIDAANSEIVARIFATIPSVMHTEGVDESGYRAVINTNADGGQTVYHLHVHVLAGRALSWPPG